MLAMMSDVCAGRVRMASISYMLVRYLFGRPLAKGHRDASLAKLDGSRLHVPRLWY